MEVWKTINEHPNYEISSHGRLRNKTTGTIRALSYDSHGYAKVSIRKDKKIHTVRIHSCVAEAFIGPVPEGKVRNHINGDCADNRAENIEYVTIRENTSHSRKTQYRGVYLDRSGRYGARATIDAKPYYIGIFDTPEMASDAYIKFLNEKGIENKYARSDR